MKRTISSWWTVPYKFIMSPVIILATCLLVVSAFRCTDPLETVLHLVFVPLALVCLWLCLPLKRVQIDGNSLLISNYLKKISVPGTEIDSIRETWAIGPHLTRVWFKNRTGFGKKIMFLSTWGSPFKSHPVVEELWTMKTKSTESSQQSVGGDSGKAADGLTGAPQR